MVLTDRVMRRQVLGALALGAAGTATLAGCGIFDDDPEPVPEPDALQPLLDEALALAASYQRAALAQPGLAKRLAPIGETHRAHAQALAQLIGAVLPSTGASPSASATATEDPSGSVAALRTAETTGQQNAAAACRKTSPERAALVGSIAAARATHVEALR
jgi:hypothetical protein